MIIPGAHVKHCWNLIVLLLILISHVVYDHTLFFEFMYIPVHAQQIIMRFIKTKGVLYLKPTCISKLAELQLIIRSQQSLTSKQTNISKTQTLYLNAII